MSNTEHINDYIGPGGLHSVVVAETNSDGSTSLVGVGGGLPFAQKKLTVETSNINNVGAQPSGSEWLHNASRDLDTFTGFLDFTPTIFFDPNDTGSLNYGTEQEPYNTLADVNRVMTGNRAGTVLGIKRGSHLYTHGSATGSGLLLTCYGTSTSPVLVVPYGDPLQPMPIIDGGEVTGTGTSYVWAVSSGSVWRVACSVDTDVFENNVRCLKKTTTPAAAGECQYTGGYLYYWPRSTTNPNDGSLKIPFTQWPVRVECPDVAAVGNIKFIGLDVRYGRGNNIGLSIGATAANITSIGAMDVLFCRSSHNGFDTNSYAGFAGSTTAIMYYGVKDSVRIGSAETISSRVIGNEITDSTHHAVEFTCQDNALIEYNYVHDIFGSMYEAYCSCSGHTVRNNRAENLSGYTHLQAEQGSFALLYNYTVATYNGALAFDDTHTKNVNNKVYNNFFKNCASVMFVCVGGSGHKIYNNTCDIDHDAIFSGNAAKSHRPVGLDVRRAATPAPTGTTSAANGFLTWSNNLIYFRYSPLMKASPGYINSSYLAMETLGVGAAIPTGNKNIYINQVGYGSAGWLYNGATEGSLASYKAALASYSLDQNSDAASGGTLHPISGAAYGNVGSISLAALKYNESTGRPTTGSPLIQGGSNVNSNRLTDYIGQTVIAVATPAIGCYER